MPPPSAIATDLLAKYREMLRLRAADRDGTLADPRPAMRALAARFPGSLREIDEMPLDALEARIAALESGVSAPWMPASWRFHELLREALAAKRNAATRAEKPLVIAAIETLSRDLGLSVTETRALVFPYRRLGR